MIYRLLVIFLQLLLAMSMGCNQHANMQEEICFPAEFVDGYQICLGAQTKDVVKELGLEYDDSSGKYVKKSHEGLFEYITVSRSAIIRNASLSFSVRNPDYKSLKDNYAAIIDRCIEQYGRDYVIYSAKTAGIAFKDEVIMLWTLKGDTYVSLTFRPDVFKTEKGRDYCYLKLEMGGEIGKRLEGETEIEHPLRDMK